MRFKVGDLIRANDLNGPEVIKQYGIGIVTGDAGWQKAWSQVSTVLVQWLTSPNPHTNTRYTLRGCHASRFSHQILWLHWPRHKIVDAVRFRILQYQRGLCAFCIGSPTDF